jgi:hypothetical protein
MAGYGLVNEDFSRAPQRVAAPTLIIWGGEDRVAPLRTGQVLAAQIPNAELHVIPGAGHAPITEQPQQVLALLQPHLEGRTPEHADNEAAEPAADQRGQLTCDHLVRPTYAGRIERLVLNGCNAVLIRDAQIGGLEVISSTVQIEDSVIEGQDIGLDAQGSTVSITGGEVAGRVAIRTAGSRFDIAGTRLSGTEAAVEALSGSSFIFSLGRIASPYWPDDVIHGYQRLEGGRRL